MVVDTEGPEAQLISDFSSTLETALVLAILSDFNLADPLQFNAARDTLEELRKSAAEEEATGFDASTSSGANALLYNVEGSRGDNDSGSGKTLSSDTDNTDNTELSHEISSLDIHGSLESDKTEDEGSYGAELDYIDPETKEVMMIEMFPGLKPFDVNWALKKGNWDISKAIDDLMTQSFLQENGTWQRGIEAFSKTDLPPQIQRGKGKGKKRRFVDDSSMPITPNASTVSKWDTGRKEVEFIATRTGITPKEIGSLYHKNGASIRATIMAILEAQAAKKIECDDPLIESSAIDLGHEFPAFPPHLLLPLIQITHPSTANAHELVRALVFQPASNKLNIHIELRHAPLELDQSSLKSKSVSALTSGPNLETASAMASRHARECRTAFAQASAAYRKGKSDHLMGAAAAYYSEVGRAADSHLKSAQMAVADELVSRQSSEFELDLHGVNVQDAKRITKERVTTWWHQLGESRINGRRVAAGYRIVTGVGYHSKGGKSKLAPAILKMLMRDGWKVQVETGVLVVTGIATKQ